MSRTTPEGKVFIGDTKDWVEEEWAFDDLATLLARGIEIKGIMREASNRYAVLPCSQLSAYAKWMRMCKKKSLAGVQEPLHISWDGGARFTLDSIDVSNWVNDASYEYTIPSFVTHIGEEIFQTETPKNMPARVKIVWDKCRCTDLSDMFAHLTLKELIVDIDTRRVSNMSYMFNDTKLRWLSLSDRFDTSRVTSMQGMFDGFFMVAGAATYDLVLPDSFVTSNVRDFSYMFRYCDLRRVYMRKPFSFKSAKTVYKMFDGSSIDDGEFPFANEWKVPTWIDTRMMFNNCRMIIPKQFL